MSKLDENYLNVIRNTLYKSVSTRENKSKEKRTEVLQAGFETCLDSKHVTCFDTEKDDLKLGNGGINNTIYTPSKSSSNGIDSVTEKVSPSLDNGNLKKKKKKRSLASPPTISDISSGIVKQKNKKFGRKQTTNNGKLEDHLSNGWSTDNSSNITSQKKSGFISVTNNDCEIFFPPVQNSCLDGSGKVNVKITETKTKRSNNLAPTKDKYVLPSNDSTVAKKKLKQTQILKEHRKSKPRKKFPIASDIPTDESDIPVSVAGTSAPTLKQSSLDEHAADFYDNIGVVTTNMKFKAFSNLFLPTRNEQLLKLDHTFMVATKYYDLVESDDIELNIDKFTNITQDHVSEIRQGDVFKQTSSSDNGTSEKAPRSKKKQNKINTFDSQDLSYSTQSNSPMYHNDERNRLTELCNEEGLELLEESLQHLDKSQLTEPCNEEAAESLKHLDKSQTSSFESENSEQMYSPARIVNLKDETKIVILQQQSQTVHFNGICSLRVLSGEVEILGACLNQDSGEHKVYSPRGSSLLYMRNISKLDLAGQVRLKELVSEELLDTDALILSFGRTCAVLRCRKLKEPYIEFIEKHISQKIFPENVNMGPRVDFVLSGRWNKIRDSELWKGILDNIMENTKTVICGGKGVGKSTFLRYSINVLLKKFKKIRIVDLDPGQAEFYPGCISVTTIDDYLLGPNYTHLKSADRILLSHINMGFKVEQYLNSVRNIIETMETMESLPTLINLPGYTQGLGLKITAKTLKLIAPTLVIEFKSTNHSKNYKVDMTSENVKKVLRTGKTLRGGEPTHHGTVLNYNYVALESLSVRSEGWSLEARQAREICILSYFGKMMVDTAIDLLSSEINMFSINISAVTIANLEGQEISPLAINANLVALCSTIDGTPELFIAYGYGFVRGIDIEADALVLLTPEPLEILENVSHLVLSSVTTPPSLIMSSDAVKGHIPFTSVGDLVDFGQFTKRSYLPPRK